MFNNKNQKPQFKILKLENIIKKLNSLFINVNEKELIY